MMEVEYIALYAAGKQSAWIQNVYKAIRDQMADYLEVYCDNQAAMAVANKEGTNEAKKHFDVKLHYTQEPVKKNKTGVMYIESEDNEANVLTKCLTGKPFGNALTLLGLEILVTLLV